MKVRTDFVTNSSSSCFILGFKSEKEIEEVIARDLGINLEKEAELSAEYGDDDWYEQEVPNYLDSGFSAKDFYDRIIEDCKSSEKISFEDVLKEHEWHLHHDVAYDIEFHHPALQNKSWSERYDLMQTEKFQKLVDEEYEKLVKELKEEADKNGYKIFVNVNYSDNDGRFGSTLEHEVAPSLSCSLYRVSYH